MPSSHYHLRPASESCQCTVSCLLLTVWETWIINYNYELVCHNELIAHGIRPGDLSLDMTRSVHQCEVLAGPHHAWDWVDRVTVAPHPACPASDSRPILQLHQLCCGHKLDFSLDSDEYTLHNTQYPPSRPRVSVGASWCVNFEAWNRVTLGML